MGDLDLNKLTADQIADSIPRAIKAGDAQAVEGLIILLALRDPKRAQEVLDTIELGIALSRAADLRGGRG